MLIESYHVLGALQLLFETPVQNPEDFCKKQFQFFLNYRKTTIPFLFLIKLWVYNFIEKDSKTGVFL